jgi:hypothetical protein
MDVNVRVSDLIKQLKSPARRLSQKEMRLIHEKIAIAAKAQASPEHLENSLRYLLRDYMKHKELKKAEQVAKDILAMHPEDTQSLYNLACVYALTCRYAQALECFKTYCERDPRYRQLHNIESLLEDLIKGTKSESLMIELKKRVHKNSLSINSSRNIFYTQKCDFDTLLIAFTGFGNKLQLPTHRFFEEAKLSKHSKIIIYDASFQKTLGGLPPYADSFEEFVEFLKTEVAEIAPKKVITLGCSAGAHSALLLGHLLKVDAVFAFAPFPYLSFEKSRAMNDPLQDSPTARKINQLAAKAGQYFDLAPILANWNGVTEYEVHVCKDHEWDVKRANTLQSTPKLSIHAHPGKSHAVAIEMARSRTLDQCFKKYNCLMNNR